MSVQARRSNPAILNWRDSKVLLMNHTDPGLLLQFLNLSHFSMDWKSLPGNARSCYNSEVFLNIYINSSFFFLFLLSGTTIASMNGEMVESGSLE